MTDELHEFGGRHTDDKLNRLARYMAAYTTALRNQGFTLVYIDAFAGSGDRAETHPALPLFDGQASAEVVNVPGSARLALQTDPPFEILVLIEKDRGRFASLQKLSAEYPQRKVYLHQGDANNAVKQICSKIPWRKLGKGTKGVRGVLFLDPYGMEVDWSTIAAVAATEAIDVWCFFPLSGLYRQAAREVLKITDDKRRRLNSVLGTTDWEDHWYGTPHGPTDLFGDEASAIRTADVDAIEAYVQGRLSSVFKGAVLSPRRIYNSRGAPIASLFFAISNPHPKAVAVAKRIAGNILKR